MKKNLPICLLALFLLFLSSCSKDDTSGDIPDDTSSVVLPSEANDLAKILVIPNNSLVNSAAIPESSSIGEAPIVSNIDTNISYSAGSNIFLPADLYSPTQVNIKGVYVQVKGADSYYDVAINSNTYNGLISLPIGLPSIVGAGDFVLILKFYDDNGKVSAINEINVTVNKAESCGKTKVSGGHGLTSNLFTLPETSGEIKISYDTFTVKDKIDVFQNGIWIGGTGSYTERGTLRRALNCSVATEALGYVGEKGEFIFEYNPNLGKEIEVVVSGCEMGGTKWEYEFSCPGDFTIIDKSPIITTFDATLITSGSGATGGNTDANGGPAITQRGVVWSTSTSPTTDLSTKLIEGEGDGNFYGSLNDLQPNTTYYVRAFAVNSNGTFYGNEISFTTTETVVTGFSLDGQWISPSGVGIIISGDSGTLYSFSPNWEIAKNNGYVTVGSVKLKEIAKVNETTWNCRDLYLTTTNGNIDGVTWSNDGTITMSADGESITTTSTGPVSGNVGSITYTRVH